ncbi:MAG: Ubiquinone/menaquinone biosynthesis C-methylase UbiE [Frankiales bacterium]|nr:Ubiquinone/menaquinone biosynthesis C-methylase UbiE [Frankiales bacterium]
MSTTDQTARVAGIFDRSAQTYDAVGVPWFTPIAAGLVDQLDLRPGERVLDVGCGRGAALFPLAERVGPSGHVTGIDLAPGMIAATAKDVASRGLTNVTLQLMDASDPDLPTSSYDVIASSLVLFFLPDPPAALRTWRALLAPGGRIGVATFMPPEPRWRALDAVFRPYLPPQLLDARTSGSAGPFETDAGVEQLLRDAGIDEVRTVSSQTTVVFTDLEQWHAFSWSHGQRAMWEAVPEGERAKVRAQAEQVLESGRDDDGALRLTQGIRYTLGHV